MNRATNYVRLSHAPELDMAMPERRRASPAGASAGGSEPSQGSEVDAIQSLRILLADDNHEMRRLIALVLRRDGHEVIEVEDGAALLDEMASVLLDSRVAAFDLVISEHCMPGIPGLSLLAGLRMRDPLTPFILITQDAAVQAGARELGALILDRPFNVEAIRRAIRAAQQADQVAGADADADADAAR